MTNDQPHALRVLLQLDEQDPVEVAHADLTRANLDDPVPAVLEALAAEWRRTGHRP
jgi:hypothetical protein